MRLEKESRIDNARINNKYYEHLDEHFNDDIIFKRGMWERQSWISEWGFKRRVGLTVREIAFCIDQKIDFIKGSSPKKMTFLVVFYY